MGHRRMQRFIYCTGTERLRPLYLDIHVLIVERVTEPSMLGICAVAVIEHNRRDQISTALNKGVFYSLPLDGQSMGIVF